MTIVEARAVAVYIRSTETFHHICSDLSGRRCSALSKLSLLVTA
ncbi:hypothetical protein [Rhodospirillum sp. A1_3_36]